MTVLSVPNPCFHTDALAVEAGIPRIAGAMIVRPNREKLCHAILIPRKRLRLAASTRQSKQWVIGSNGRIKRQRRRRGRIKLSRCYRLGLLFGSNTPRSAQGEKKKQSPDHKRLISKTMPSSSGLRFLAKAAAGSARPTRNPAPYGGHFPPPHGPITPDDAPKQHQMIPQITTTLHSLR